MLLLLSKISCSILDAIFIIIQVQNNTVISMGPKLRLKIFV